MGCLIDDDKCRDAERPRHQVEITEGFWIGATEVTVRAYKRFLGYRRRPPHPSFNADWLFDDHPIVSVTWQEAKTFCEWAGGRLPTEAEWEYAARGGTPGWKYPWGVTLSRENANYGKEECCGGWAEDADTYKYTAPVKSFGPTKHGLYDMAGNVMEWCSDWYDEKYYSSSPAVDPQGPTSGKSHVLRGGDWNNPPDALRTSFRMPRSEPGKRADNVGFRCVLDEPTGWRRFFHHAFSSPEGQ